jgi:hypothetical protein
MIQSRKVLSAAYVARMVAMRNSYTILVDEFEGESKLRGLRLDEVIPKIYVKELGYEGCGTDSTGSRQGMVAVSCEHITEDDELLDQQSDY